MTLEYKIGQVLEDYKSAVRAKNADDLVALFSDDVRIFDVWDNWSLQGKAAWRRAVQQWFASLGDDTDVVDFDDVVVLGDGVLAAMSCVATYTAMSPEWKELRSMQNRVSLVLSRRNDRWEIVHQHSSVPIKGADMTPTLRQL